MKQNEDDFLRDDLEPLEFLEGDLGTRNERIRALKYLLKQAENSTDRSLHKSVMGYRSRFLDPRVTKKEVTEIFFYLWEKISGQGKPSALVVNA